jgi:hypothetical protein
MALAAPVVGEPQAIAIARVIEQLDQLKDVGALMSMLQATTTRTT